MSDVPGYRQYQYYVFAVYVDVYVAMKCRAELSELSEHLQHIFRVETVDTVIKLLPIVPSNGGPYFDVTEIGSSITGLGIETSSVTHISW